MVKHDGSFTKTQRMSRIAAYVAPKLAEGATINIEKLIAWIEINIGLTRKRAEEYLNTLASAYDWNVKDGFLNIESV